jgi:hypothetical protein
MRKNLARPGHHFRNATPPLFTDETCPQFLWINLCEIVFPKGKPLIFLMEIFEIKKRAARSRCSSPSASSASSQFLWTKLCASAHILTKSLIDKGKLVEPVF